jgi:hypothetical protein
LEQGLLRQDGLGKCKNPFRYWLPESKARWRKDPLSIFRMPELFGLRAGWGVSHNGEPGASATGWTESGG